MIELKQIYKSYEIKSGKVNALAGVSLRVEKGEIYGVIGRSGAGKSTLIRCVNLLERPDQGQVLVNDQSLMGLPAADLRQVRHKMGMVFQHFNLLHSRTVFGNVSFPLELVGKKKSEISQLIPPLLDLVGLADLTEAYPHQLSGGQKQRVAIARALATEPVVLLCDEMTSSLDPQTTQSILSLIKDINKKMGLTILLITHEMDVIKQICDKVSVLHAGEVIEQGEVVKIFSAPQHEMTRRLTQAAFHLELPLLLQEKVTDKPLDNSYTLLRLLFVGDAVVQPLMNDLIKKFNLQITILQSDLEILHNKPIGMMLVAAKGLQQEINQAVDHLSSLGLTIEVVGYVATDDWHLS